MGGKDVPCTQRRLAPLRRHSVLPNPPRTFSRTNGGYRALLLDLPLVSDRPVWRLECEPLFQTFPGKRDNSPFLL